MHWFFTNRFGTRDWPKWAQFGATTVLVALAALLTLRLWPILDGYPFLLFYPAIIGCAVLFDHRSGVLAVVLSALAAKLLLLPPTGSLRIAESHDALALSLFILISLATALVIEELHRALRRATVANKKLAAAEEEKDLLLREATHRFRNDLSVMVALLRMQERSIEEAKARAALRAASDRLAVMGRVHERLQRTDGSVAVVSIDEFIQSLRDDLRTARIGLRPITLEVAVEHHLLSHDRAVAVGLIINELVTNALKYAFPGDRPGHVRVSFARAGDEFVLCVSDTGVGVAPHTGAKGSGLGQRLVRSMANQIGGTLHIQSNEGEGGTAATVRFPVPD